MSHRHFHFLCRSIDSQYIGSMFKTKDHSMAVHCPIYSASDTSARAWTADEKQLREKPPRERRRIGNEERSTGKEQEKCSKINTRHFIRRGIRKEQEKKNREDYERVKSHYLLIIKCFIEFPIFAEIPSFSLVLSWCIYSLILLKLEGRSTTWLLSTLEASMEGVEMVIIINWRI